MGPPSRPLRQADYQHLVAAATTPEHRMTLALAAVHAARPSDIRQLRLDAVNLGDRTITVADHFRILDDLTLKIIRDYLRHRRSRWPDTADPHRAPPTTHRLRRAAYDAPPTTRRLRDQHGQRHPLCACGAVAARRSPGAAEAASGHVRYMQQPAPVAARRFHGRSVVLLENAESASAVHHDCPAFRG
jgi:integrase